MAVEESRFWIIWNPGAQMPPTKTFTTPEQARKVAEAMAVRFSGHKFYVMEASEYYQTERVVRKKLIYA